MPQEFPPIAGGVDYGAPAGGFAPMPGFGGMPGGPSEEEMRRQQEEMDAQRRRMEEEQRRQMAKEALKTFTRERGLTAEQASQAVNQMPRTEAPFDIKIGMDEQGVSTLGGRTKVQFSPRIGATFGGAYAPGRAATGEVMGQQTTINAPGQYAAQAGYRSPFINVDVEYAPRRSDPFGQFSGGFSGRANMQTKW